MEVTQVKFTPSSKSLGKEQIVLGFKLLSFSGIESQVVALSPAMWVKTDKDLVLWEGKVDAAKAVVTYSDVGYPEHSLVIVGSSYSVMVDLPVCESPGPREDYDLAFTLPKGAPGVAHKGVYSVPAMAVGPLRAITGFLPSLPGR